MHHSADETGLSVEEIGVAVGSHGQQAAVEVFLASCRTVAEIQQNSEFLQLALDTVVARGEASLGRPEPSSRRPGSG